MYPGSKMCDKYLFDILRRSVTSSMTANHLWYIYEIKLQYIISEELQYFIATTPLQRHYHATTTSLLRHYYATTLPVTLYRQYGAFIRLSISVWNEICIGNVGLRLATYKLAGHWMGTMDLLVLVARDKMIR